MCEKCVARRERNTQIKRAAMDALFAVNDSPTAAEIPGFLTFLALAQLMERISRSAPAGGTTDEQLAAQFRAVVIGLSPEGRTDVVRLADFVADMVAGIRMNVATAKSELKDKDGTTIALMLEGSTIVIYVNGEEVQRLELPVGQDTDAALTDAAERAMQAHREVFERHG